MKFSVPVLSTLAAMATAAPSRRASRMSRLSGLRSKANGTMSAAEYINESWAGAVVTGSSFTGVSATFTVPTPLKPTDGAQQSAPYHIASAWIGMDGYDCSGGLWQAGVDGTIESSGTTYYAWYEWYPENTMEIDLGDTKAGDVITIELTSSPSNYKSGKIVMSNKTTGKSYSATVTDSLALCGTSIEWIVEDLIVDGSEIGLANFGTVTFSGAKGTTSSGTVTPASAEYLDIADSNNYQLTQSSSTSDTVVIKYI
ncbi:aspergillopepsin-2 [Xylaria arbuscula]|nr:aspergillopepsin-2 [Xylaria arbuscula]